MQKTDQNQQLMVHMETIAKTVNEINENIVKMTKLLRGTKLNTKELIIFKQLIKKLAEVIAEYGEASLRFETTFGNITSMYEQLED